MEQQYFLLDIAQIKEAGSPSLLHALCWYQSGQLENLASHFPVFLNLSDRIFGYRRPGQAGKFHFQNIIGDKLNRGKCRPEISSNVGRFLKGCVIKYWGQVECDVKNISSNILCGSREYIWEIFAPWLGRLIKQLFWSLWRGHSNWPLCKISTLSAVFTLFANTGHIFQHLHSWKNIRKHVCNAAPVKKDVFESDEKWAKSWHLLYLISDSSKCNGLHSALWSVIHARSLKKNQIAWIWHGR